MLSNLPLLLTYALVLLVAREVWCRRRPFPQHRRGVALGVAWERHTGVTEDTAYIFKKKENSHDGYPADGT